MLCIHHINSNSEAWPFRRRHNVHQPYHRHAINVHGNTGEQSDFYLISKDDLSLYYRNIIHKRQPLSRLFSLRRSHYDSFGVSISFDSILLSDPTQPSSSSFDILFRLWAALEIFEIFQTCHSSESVQALVTIGGKDVTLLLMVEMCKMVKLCSDFPSQGLAPPPSPTPLPPPPSPKHSRYNISLTEKTQVSCDNLRLHYCFYYSLQCLFLMYETIVIDRQKTAQLFMQVIWKCKLTTVTSWKADVSSVSPSSERMEELWVVCWFIWRKWSYAIGGNTATRRREFIHVFLVATRLKSRYLELLLIK